MHEEFKWITYSSVACSSIMEGTSLQVLGTSDVFDDNSWESGRFGEYPLEVIIRLDFRIQGGHLKLASKANKPIPKLEVYIGDGLHGSFVDTKYHLAGTGERIGKSPKQIPLMGFGSFVKLLFTEKPKVDSVNPFGQVSLSQLKVWGRPLRYEMTYDQLNSAIAESDEVDKVLLGTGIPLELIIWSKESKDNFRHAPVDEDSRETLIELDLKRDQAFQEEDYSALKQLTTDIKRMYDVGTQILQLRRELKVAVSKEDYDSAILIKQKLTELEKVRDSIDALYETSRYQRMIVMGMPSEAHMSMVNALLEEERLRADELRRLQEEEQRRREQQEREELERQRRLAEMREKKPAPRPVKKTAKKRPKTPEVEDDKFVYNVGDADLESYLRPKLNEVGGNLRKADLEILKRADVQNILNVVGVNLWSAIYSDNWRHRLAAFIAFLEFLEAPLLPKYQSDTRGLFKAAIELATISCEDRVLPVYLNGLKILITAMSSPICDHKVTPKMINEAMRIFIPILLNKVSELNYRARAISMNTLIELFRHPHIKIGPLVDHIMILTASSEGPVSKQPWRILFPRLEILLHILQEYGVSKQWSWRKSFDNLLLPCLEHAKSEVRDITLDIVITMYQKIGMEFRLVLDSVGNRIKPQQSKIIYNRMLEIDQSRPEGMPTIQEEPAAKKNASWSQLKDKISSLEKEEGENNRKTKKK